MQTADKQDEASPTLSPKRQWAALAALSLPTLLISMDSTILGFAIPRLSQSLEPSSSQLLWIIDVYSFVLAGLLVTMGNLGDRIGRRRLLLIGAAGFSIASVLAAFATSTATLIAARALLGIAGATLLPSTLSLIRNVFTEPRRRATAIAVWASMFGAGAALGPILGGFLLNHYWWGSVFLAGVPITVGLVIVGPLLVPESKDPNPGPFDFTSSVLSIMTMLPFVYGIKQLAEHGITVTAIASIVVGILAGVVFVRRQRNSLSPMIDITLFKLSAFRNAVGGNLVACLGFAGSLFFVTQYFQLVSGLSPMRAGLQLIPAVCGSMIAAMLAPGLARSHGPFTVIASGLGFAALGFVGLSQVDANGGLIAATIAIPFINAGLGMAMTVALDGILASVPPDKAGAGASVSETANELGFALGTALLGSVLTVVYRNGFDNVTGFSPEVVAEARETLGAAELAATNLGGVNGDALRVTARVAFTDGMTIATLIGAAIIAVAAIAAARVARTTRAQPALIGDLAHG